MIADTDDEFETPEEAQARLAITSHDGVFTGIAANASREPDVVTVDFGVFNDAEFWNSLFATGEISPEMKPQLLDEPLRTTANLRAAVRFADITNEERARQGKMDLYGPVKVRTQTTTKTPWEDVPYDDIDAARGR